MIQVSASSKCAVSIVLPIRSKLGDEVLQQIAQGWQLRIGKACKAGNPEPRY